MDFLSSHVKDRQSLLLKLALRQTALVMPLSYFSTHEIMLTLASYLVIQIMFFLILLGGGGRLDRIRDGVVDEAVDADESR